PVRTTDSSGRRSGWAVFHSMGDAAVSGVAPLGVADFRQGQPHRGNALNGPGEVAGAVLRKPTSRRCTRPVVTFVTRDTGQGAR
ncbi:MAG: hypothetical protein QHJ73_01180, partial [Armatimonadota bacterium]|nr:hypothetical protein [Armatimonadota bacterium]